MNSKLLKMIIIAHHSLYRSVSKLCNPVISSQLVSGKLHDFVISA